MFFFQNERIAPPNIFFKKTYEDRLSFNTPDSDEAATDTWYSLGAYKVIFWYLSEF